MYFIRGGKKRTPWQTNANISQRRSKTSCFGHANRKLVFLISLICICKVLMDCTHDVSKLLSVSFFFQNRDRQVSNFLVNKIVLVPKNAHDAQLGHTNTLKCDRPSDKQTDDRTDERTNGLTDGRADGRMDGRLNG